MHRTLLATLALTTVAAGTTAAVLAAPASAGATTAFQTSLSGAAEVPGPGDADGAGNAVVRVDAASGEVCYVVTTHGTAPLVAGHLHRKAPGTQAGGVVLPFAQASATSFRGCAVSPNVAAGLLADPSAYYVNVHSADFPGGALRGDLG